MPSLPAGTRAHAAGAQRRLIELDTNRYSVPWKLIGDERDRRRRRVIERAHLAGIVGANLVGVSWPTGPLADGSPATLRAAISAELLRPLAEYESALGRSLVVAAGKKAKASALEVSGDLEPMLTRLKLSAIRDQLDTLLEQAGAFEPARGAVDAVCGRGRAQGWGSALHVAMGGRP
jgi:hypothetical protein